MDSRPSLPSAMSLAIDSVFLDNNISRDLLMSDHSCDLVILMKEMEIEVGHCEIQIIIRRREEEKGGWGCVITNRRLI